MNERLKKCITGGMCLIAHVCVHFTFPVYLFVNLMSIPLRIAKRRIYKEPRMY